MPTTREILDSEKFDSLSFDEQKKVLKQTFNEKYQNNPDFRSYYEGMKMDVAWGDYLSHAINHKWGSVSNLAESRGFLTLNNDYQEKLLNEVYDDVSDAHPKHKGEEKKRNYFEKINKTLGYKEPEEEEEVEGDQLQREEEAKKNRPLRTREEKQKDIRQEGFLGFLNKKFGGSALHTVPAYHIPDEAERDLAMHRLAEEKYKIKNEKRREELESYKKERHPNVPDMGPSHEQMREEAEYERKFEQNYVTALSNKKYLNRNEVSFLLAPDESGTPRWEKYANPENREDLSIAIEEARERLGDTEGFGGQFTEEFSRTFDLKEPTQPTTFGGKAGQGGAQLVMSLLPTVAGFMVGGVVGGASTAGAVSYVRTVLQEGRRGNLPPDISEEEFERINKLALKHGLTDFVLTGIPVGAGLATAKKVSTATGKKFLGFASGEAVDLSLTAALEKGMTGEVRPETLALTALPLAASMGGKAMTGSAKQARRGVKAGQAKMREKFAPRDDLRMYSSNIINPNLRSKGIELAYKPDLEPGEVTKFKQDVERWNQYQELPVSERMGILEEYFDADPAKLQDMDLAETVMMAGKGPEFMEEFRIQMEKDGIAPYSHEAHEKMMKQVRDEMNEVRGEIDDVRYDPTSHAPDLVRNVFKNIKEKFLFGISENVRNTTELGTDFYNQAKLFREATEMEKGKIGDDFLRSRDQYRKALNKSQREYADEVVYNIVSEKRKASQGGGKIKESMRKKGLTAEQAEIVYQHAMKVKALTREVGLNMETAKVKLLRKGLDDIKPVKEGKYTYLKKKDGTRLGKEELEGLGIVPQKYTKKGGGFKDESAAQKALDSAKVRDFRMTQGYAPRVFDWGRVKKGSAKELLHLAKVMNKIYEGNGATKPFNDAELSRLESMTKKNPKKAAKWIQKVMESQAVKEEMGSTGVPIHQHMIERGENSLPKKFLRKDQDVYMEHLNNAVDSYMMARHWGPSGEKAYSYVGAIGKEAAKKFGSKGSNIFKKGRMYGEELFPGKVDDATAAMLRAKMLADALTGNVKPAEISPATEFALNFMVVTKMMSSALSQSAQVGMSASYGNMKSFLKANRDFFMDIVRRDGIDSAKSWVRRTGLTMDLQVREAMAVSRGGTLGFSKVGATYLKAIGFTKMDMVSRTVASLTGKYYSQELVEKLARARNAGNDWKAQRYRDLLEELTDDPDRLLRQLDDGTWVYNMGLEDHLKMSRAFEVKTNFRNYIEDLPEFRHGGVSLLLTQFKTFIFHQQRLLATMWRRAAKKAKRGDYTLFNDLARFTMMSTATGMGVHDIRKGFGNVLAHDESNIKEVMQGEKDAGEYFSEVWDLTLMQKVLNGREGVLNAMIQSWSTAGALGMLEMLWAGIAHQDPQMGPAHDTYINVLDAIRNAKSMNEPGLGFALGLADAILPSFLSDPLVASMKQRRTEIHRIRHPEYDPHKGYYAKRKRAREYQGDLEFWMSIDEKDDLEKTPLERAEARLRKWMKEAAIERYKRQ